MTIETAKGMIKHRQPVQFGTRWFYILSILADGKRAQLGPCGYGLQRGFYTVAALEDLE